MYSMLTSRIFLDFNWITSISNFEMLGGYRLTSIINFKMLGGYHLIHGAWSEFSTLTSITNFKMLGGYASPHDHAPRSCP